MAQTVFGYRIEISPCDPGSRSANPVSVVSGVTLPKSKNDASDTVLKASLAQINGLYKYIHYINAGANTSTVETDLDALDS